MIERTVNMGIPGTASIAVVAGSENDLKTIAESGMFEIFEHAGISFELDVISADRNADIINEFCLMVNKNRKVKVIITVAGLAAVLGSAIKANVGIIPVLAAPLDEDALRTNISKPKGMAIGVCGANGLNACYNAGMLASEIVAAGDPCIAAALEAFAGIKRVEKLAQFCIDPAAVKEKYLKNKR